MLQLLKIAILLRSIWSEFGAFQRKKKETEVTCCFLFLRWLAILMDENPLGLGWVHSVSNFSYKGPVPKQYLALAQVTTPVSMAKFKLKAWPDLNKGPGPRPECRP